MIKPWRGATVEKFDEAAMKELETMKDVRVYDSVRPDGDNSGCDYVIYMPNTTSPGSHRKHMPITGRTEASVIHHFGIMIASTSPKARSAILAAVRRRMIGFQIPGTSEAYETGELNSYGRTDATIMPVRYTAYATFQVVVDRSV